MLEKVVLERWLKKLMAGKVVCPYKNCNLSFSTLKRVALHLQNDCSFVGNDSSSLDLPCLYCASKYPVAEFVQHLMTTHKEITSVTRKLSKGNQINCPNYTCKKLMSDSGSYIAHAVSCRPLYQCSRCKVEISSSNNYTGHLRKCTGTPIHTPKVVANRIVEAVVQPKCSKASFLKHMKSWKNSFANGRLSCPFPVCGQVFKSPSDLQRHMKAEAAVNQDLFRKVPLVSCHFCGVEVGIMRLAVHIADYHRELFYAFQKVARGKQFNCPNNACTMIFTPDTSMLYYGHAITCRPQYKCPECGQVFVNAIAKNKARHLLLHQKSGGLSDGRNLQRRYSRWQPATGNDDLMQEEGISVNLTRNPKKLLSPQLNLMSLKTGADFQPVRDPAPSDAVSLTSCHPNTEHDLLSPQVKSGLESSQSVCIYSTESSSVSESCPESRLGPLSLHTRIDVHTASNIGPHSLGTIVEGWYIRVGMGVWQCPYPNCTEKFANPSDFVRHMTLFPLNDCLREKIFDDDSLPCCFCPVVTPLATYDIHMTTNHDDLVAPVLFKHIQYVCPLCKREELLDLDYLLHVSRCCRDFQHGKSGKEKVDELYSLWKKDLSNGILRCGNVDCGKRFVFWSDLLDHFHLCRSLEPDVNKLILAADEVVCPHCKFLVTLKTFSAHLMTDHGPIYDQLLNNGDRLSCPNYGCSKECKDAYTYLEHIVICPTCLFCCDCKCMFNSSELFYKHSCLADDDDFISKTLDLWQNEIKAGQLRCINPACNSSFFVPEDFIDHLRNCERKSRFCKRIWQKNSLACSFCPSNVRLTDFVEHMKETHSDVYQDLHRIADGHGISCRNCKCSKAFTDGLKYFQHCVVCKPVYNSKSCEKEFFRQREVKLPDFTSENASTKVNEDSIEEWYEKTKSAVFTCPSKSCSRAFQTADELVGHMKRCSKSNSLVANVLKTNLIGCCFCDKLVKISTLGAHYINFHPMVHWQLENLERYGAAVCQNRSCKRAYTEKGSYLVHALRCVQVLRCDPCGSQFLSIKSMTDHNCSVKQSLAKWYTGLSEGDLSCPNSCCATSFTSLKQFVEHLRYCKKGTDAQRVWKDGSIPCFVCKYCYPLTNWPHHLKSKHSVVSSQLRLIEKGLFIHCPKCKCKKVFSDARSYLQHAALHCKPLVLCEMCGSEFSCEEEFASHKCSQESRGKRPNLSKEDFMSSWYERVMAGDLCCPNSGCSSEFVLPGDFVAHLRACSDGVESGVVLKLNKLPCCFCKAYVAVGKYRSHLSICHQDTHDQGQAKSDSSTLDPVSSVGNGREVSCLSSLHGEEGHSLGNRGEKTGCLLDTDASSAAGETIRSSHVTGDVTKHTVVYEQGDADVDVFHEAEEELLINDRPVKHAMTLAPSDAFPTDVAELCVSSEVFPIENTGNHSKVAARSLPGMQTRAGKAKTGRNQKRLRDTSFGEDRKAVESVESSGRLEACKSPDDLLLQRADNVHLDPRIAVSAAPALALRCQDAEYSLEAGSDNRRLVPNGSVHVDSRLRSSSPKLDAGTAIAALSSSDSTSCLLSAARLDASSDVRDEFGSFPFENCESQTCGELTLETASVMRTRRRFRSQCKDSSAQEIPPKEYCDDECVISENVFQAVDKLGEDEAPPLPSGKGRFRSLRTLSTASKEALACVSKSSDTVDIETSGSSNVDECGEKLYDHMALGNNQKLNDIRGMQIESADDLDGFADLGGASCSFGECHIDDVTTDAQKHVAAVDRGFTKDFLLSFNALSDSENDQTIEDCEFENSRDAVSCAFPCDIAPECAAYISADNLESENDNVENELFETSSYQVDVFSNCDVNSSGKLEDLDNLVQNRSDREDLDSASVVGGLDAIPISREIDVVSLSLPDGQKHPEALKMNSLHEADGETSVDASIDAVFPGALLTLAEAADVSLVSVDCPLLFESSPTVTAAICAGSSDMGTVRTLDEMLRMRETSCGACAACLRGSHGEKLSSDCMSLSDGSPKHPEAFAETDVPVPWSNQKALAPSLSAIGEFAANVHQHISSTPAEMSCIRMGHVASASTNRLQPHDAGNVGDNAFEDAGGSATCVLLSKQKFRRYEGGDGGAGKTSDADSESSSLQNDLFEEATGVPFVANNSKVTIAADAIDQTLSPIAWVEDSDGSMLMGPVAVCDCSPTKSCSRLECTQLECKRIEEQGIREVSVENMDSPSTWSTVSTDHMPVTQPLLCSLEPSRELSKRPKEVSRLIIDSEPASKSSGATSVLADHHSFIPGVSSPSDRGETQDLMKPANSGRLNLKRRWKYSQGRLALSSTRNLESSRNAVEKQHGLGKDKSMKQQQASGFVSSVCRDHVIDLTNETCALSGSSVVEDPASSSIDLTIEVVCDASTAAGDMDRGNLGSWIDLTADENALTRNVPSHVDKAALEAGATTFLSNREDACTSPVDESKLISSRETSDQLKDGSDTDRAEGLSLSKRKPSTTSGEVNGVARTLLDSQAVVAKAHTKERDLNAEQTPARVELARSENESEMLEATGELGSAMVICVDTLTRTSPPNRGNEELGLEVVRDGDGLARDAGHGRLSREAANPLGCSLDGKISELSVVVDHGDVVDMQASRSPESCLVLPSKSRDFAAALESDHPMALMDAKHCSKVKMSQPKQLFSEGSGYSNTETCDKVRLSGQQCAEKLSVDLSIEDGEAVDGESRLASVTLHKSPSPVLGLTTGSVGESGEQFSICLGPDARSVSVNDVCGHLNVVKEEAFATRSRGEGSNEAGWDRRSDKRMEEANLLMFVQSGSKEERDLEQMRGDEKLDQGESACDTRDLVREHGASASSSAESLAERWLFDVRAYRFYCPFSGCIKTFVDPCELFSHLACCQRSTAAFNYRKIGALQLDCQECGKSCRVRQLLQHLKADHPLLATYLANYSRDVLTCANSDCQKTLDSIDACVAHFRECGFMWRCKICNVSLKESSKVKRHKCDSKETRLAPSKSSVENGDSGVHTSTPLARSGRKREAIRRGSLCLVEDSKQEDADDIAVSGSADGSSQQDPDDIALSRIAKKGREQPDAPVVSKKVVDLNSWKSSFESCSMFCPACGDAYFRMKELFAHLKRCAPSKKQNLHDQVMKMTLYCPGCGEGCLGETMFRHFRLRHILLNWYLSQLEAGEEVICQNYTCAASLSTSQECLEHERRCGYLWQCEHCQVVYKSESTVRGHNCQTGVARGQNDVIKTEPGEAGPLDLSQVPSPEKDNSSFSVANMTPTCASEVLHAKSGVISSVTDGTVPESRDVIDGEAIGDVPESIEEDIPGEGGAGACGSRRSDVQGRKRKIRTNSSAKPLKRLKRLSLLDGDGNAEHALPSASSMEAEDGSSTKITAETSEKLEKSDVLIWFDRLKSQIYYCPGPHCKAEFKYFIHLLVHLKTCSQRVRKFVTDVAQSIGLKLVCPDCKKKEKTIEFADFMLHLNLYHPVLMRLIKDLNANGSATCENYTCSISLTGIEQCCEHSIACGLLWECSTCDVTYTSYVSVRNHVCKPEFDSSGDKEATTPKTDAIVSRKKRKSALKAAASVTQLVNKLQDNAEGDVGIAESPADSDVADDGDFRVADVGGRQDSSDDDSASEAESALCDGRRQTPGGRRRAAKSKNDFAYVRKWFEENLCSEETVLFPSLLPDKSLIAFLQESDVARFLPDSDECAEFELCYRTRSAGTERVCCSLPLFAAMSPLHGSCSATFNVGGPVWGMDWCPVPSDDDQYLAIAAQSSFAEFHCVMNSASVPGLIQIWNVGHLKNAGSVTIQPRLMICHECGPVYDVKWCPSGCYQKPWQDENLSDSEEMRRLGLLAVACGDGKVRILSIPHTRQSQEKPVFVGIEPVVVLLPHKVDFFERSRTGVVLCLAWLPVAGHARIAGGYGDGGIRIWDITTKSILLKTEERGRSALLPIISIQAHSYAVRSLAWCPANPDLIASAGRDKCIRIFNLQMPDRAMHEFKKGLFLDVVWPIGRSGLFFTEEACLNMLPGSGRIFEFDSMLHTEKLDKRYDARSTTRHNCTVWSCSYNNRLDLIATCDNAGEVLVCKNQDGVGVKNAAHCKRTEPVYRLEATPIADDADASTKCASTAVEPDVAESVGLLSEYEKEAASDAASFRRWKYTFRDSNNFEFSQKRPKRDQDIGRLSKWDNLQSSAPTDVETRSILKVLWCPNKGCDTWLASGTRLGLVRLHNFKAWS